MHKALKVLVVDDAVATRRMLCDELAAQTGFELAGVAADAREVDRLTTVGLDCAIVGADMTGSERCRALASIRAIRPDLPILLFGPRGVRLLAASDSALDEASPSHEGAVRVGVLQMQRFIRSQVLPAILASCCGAAAGWRGSGPDSAPSSARASVIAVGASTGGINALTVMLAALPSTLDAALLVVQHMPPAVVASVVGRLAAVASIDVVEARDGAPIVPGRAYCAGGDAHLGVQRCGDEVSVRLTRTAPENSCRPSVDVLFRSISVAYGPQTLGVVLSGMGQDGLKGSEAIVNAGGRVIVQDEATSVIWGMPGTVAKAGLADAVLPLGQLADELTRRVGTGRRTKAEAGA